MNLKLIPIASLILVLSFCKKEEPINFEYFAFGTAYGECMGNCAKFFLIKDNNLYPDEMDYYTSSNIHFQSVALSKEKYNLAKELMENFPKYLKDNPNKTFGCPDCYDQGGIHIVIKENDQTLTWDIDTNLADQPIEIQPYVQEILNILRQFE
jgi:hypothetical protein